MKAYVYGANGAAIADVPKPAPKATQVLVRVRACGLNRADLGMTKGHAHGTAGGVGTVLGMEWAGEIAVIGSSPDAMRRGRLKEFGADLAVDSSDPGWVDQVLQATGGEGVDLIVDQVSGKVANQNLAATKVKGRIVNVGRLGGTHADFNFDLHAARRIHYIGVTFRTRSIEEIREIFAEVRKDIWPAVESRKLQLPIDKVF